MVVELKDFNTLQTTNGLGTSGQCFFIWDYIAIASALESWALSQAKTNLRTKKFHSPFSMILQTFAKEVTPLQSAKFFCNTGCLILAKY